MTIRRFPISAALGAALLGAALPAAQADIKVVQSTVIDNAQAKAMAESMSPQQKARILKMGYGFMTGAPLMTTIYVSGKKERVDIGTTTMIIDNGTKKMTALQRATRTYTTQSTDSMSEMSAGKGPKMTVHDTGQVKTILGHVAHHYTVTYKNTGTGGGITGDVWAASDLPHLPPTQMGGSPFGTIQQALQQIKGFPLKFDISINGIAFGKTRISSQVKSISQAPVPAALFTVPKGYVLSTSPGGMMGGSPMGGGMGY